MIKTNFKLRGHDVEAWFFSGQPYSEMPEWIRGRYTMQEMAERAVGRYAIRDEDGVFYRWMDADEFNRRYERIVP